MDDPNSSQGNDTQWKQYKNKDNNERMENTTLKQSSKHNNTNRKILRELHQVPQYL